MSLSPGFDSPIALVRAEYVLPFIDLLRRTGTPVERELRRARLPVLIEELPDSYVSTDLMFRFLQHCADREGIGNIGFEAGWQLSYDDLGPVLKDALQQAPTLKIAIETFSRLISLEDSEFRCSLQGYGEKKRICIRQYIPAGADSRIAEWQNLKAVVELVRRYQQAGPTPLTIGMMSLNPPTPDELDRLDDIRVLTGQQSTFVEIPASMLAHPRLPGRDFFHRRRKDSSALSGSRDLPGFEDDLTGRLRMALIPYLSSGHPGIELAADIAGISVRKLQRRLDLMHTSYSRLLESLRFEQALNLLQHSDLKILDIALLLGYNDASNFARAMRRISGLSPRELRGNGINGTR
jgi:AraC-like DNA-binding protein